MDGDAEGRLEIKNKNMYTLLN